MPATPRKLTHKAAPLSPAQALIGRSVAIPSDVFKEKAEYTGVVTGTPRRKDAVYVKVDQDNTQYWFPTAEVEKWVVEDTSLKARPSSPLASRSGHTPRKRGHKVDGNQSDSASLGRASRRQLRAQSDQYPVQATDSSQQQQQHITDAASSQAERPEDLAETIEALVGIFRAEQSRGTGVCVTLASSQPLPCAGSYKRQ